MLTAQQVKTALRKVARPERAVVSQGFFKTKEGQSAAGDEFIGASGWMLKEVGD